MVEATIASTLKVAQAPGQPLVERLTGYLREQQCLLLDNCEHLLEAALLLATLLAACPRLKVLATSRSALRLSGEHEWAVRPLALPDLRQLPALEALARYEAIALFAQRAQAVQPDFALSEANATAAAEICVRLDGLPLAIELAAARSKVLPPAALLRGLSDRLRLLTGGSRDVPERQRTLRATFAWSYALLDRDEQTLFARLAIFVGGWTLDAASAVCSRADDREGDSIDVLEALLTKGLVRGSAASDAPSADDSPRFDMLETIRAYALERLTASGDGARLGQAHARFFLALAERAEPQLEGAQQADWLARLEADLDNLRAALAWSQTEPEGAEIGVRLAAALGRFWYKRGHHGEGRAWLERTLEGARARSGSPPGGTRAMATARAKALLAAGSLAWFKGEHARSNALVEQSLATYRDLGDHAGAAWALLFRGRSARTQGDYARAMALLEDARALARGHGVTSALPFTLIALGSVARDQGDAARAETLFGEALDLCRDAARGEAAALARLYLGRVALDRHDTARAGGLLEASLALYRQLGDRNGIAWALLDLGHLARARGDAMQAMRSTARACA